ncbi:MAG: phage holin family protein [Bacteroidia bacterium]|nr:phage holin family protein [Bacteroidia bacterium]
MTEKPNFIEPLLNSAEDYAKTSVQLAKLQLVDKTANLTSTLISRGIAFLSLILSLVIANIGVALWLGNMLGKIYYGFFAVALFYGCVGGIVYCFMHTGIKTKVSNAVITQLLK